MNAPGQFFHGFADTFDSLYDGQRTLVWRVLDNAFRRDIYERFRLSFERLGDLRHRRVADVGCGSGVYLREALARGAREVIGLDAAPRMLALASRRLDGAGYAGRYQLVEGTYPEVQLPGGADCAIVMGVMDYVAAPVTFLRSLREQLGGGLAVISFPSWHWLRSPVREVRYRLRSCPLFIYRKERVEAVLAEAGLRPVVLQKIEGAGQDFHVTCR